MDEHKDTSIRNLGFAAWRNELAWMEAMKGSAWKKVLREERTRFRDALRPLRGLIPELEKELEKTQQPDTEAAFEAARGEILIQPTNTLSIRWRLREKGSRWHSAVDLDARSDGHIWSIHDAGKGAEDYMLQYSHKGKRVWTKAHVGPDVCIVGQRCYFLEAEGLWYNKLYSCIRETGQDKRLHFEQKDPQWNLELLRVHGGQAVLRANRAGQQSLWDIPETGTCRRLWPDGQSFVPVTATSAFVRARGKRTFVLRGPLAKSFRMPNLKKHIPEAFHLETATLITRRYGTRTVWKCSGSAPAQKIQTILGSIEPDPWTGSLFYFSCPGLTPYFGKPDAKPPADSQYAVSSYEVATSKDGTRVPVLVITSNPHPGALLVSAYGAYGIPSSMSTQRWKPLLDRGWAIAIALVRGGGDHDDAWAEAARRSDKIKSVEDLEACVRHVQRELDISAKTTILFGRSAGGYLVGATLNRHPDGGLAAAVYTEVPYVDVLRTTTNPALPLTQLEYEEFGWPAERLANFGALLDLSPVNGVPAGGIPGVFVLCRTATNDQEVLAYESVKWIQHLRVVSGQPKLLAIASDEGHFAPASTIFRQRAEDLALLLGWESQAASGKKSQPLIYKMAKGSTRKNRKTERKSRKAERKSRKAERKSRRANRKSRRTNRK